MEYNEFLELANTSIQNCIHVGNGTFEEYKSYIDSFTRDYPNVIKQYGLTESELFVMFMMLYKNFDEIQQCTLSGKGSQFAKECVRLFDSFLSKVPRSKSNMFYRVDQYQRIENFINKSTYDCNHYFTASTNYSILENYQHGVKLFIHRRLIGKTKAHDVFVVNNVNNEFQVIFERNTRFEVNSLDKKNKIVELTEL